MTRALESSSELDGMAGCLATDMRRISAPDQVFVTRIARESADTDFHRLLETVAPERAAACRHMVIKINLCDYRLAETGATTDPALLAALVRQLRKLNPAVRITVLENDASSVEADSLFSLLGFREVARALDIELHNASRHPWVKRDLPGGIVFRQLEIPAVVEEADLVINFAKLKTNAISKTTGCLKNLFALLRPKRKSVYHGILAECIADINMAVRSDLCIVDGLIGMGGLGGPAFGVPHKRGLLLGGLNPVSADACCARIMGFRPRSVEHLRVSARRRLGTLRYRLATDIPGFRYKDHKFEFSRWQYLLRCLLRGSAGVE